MDGQSPKLETLIENLRQQLSLYTQLFNALREEKNFLITTKVKEIRESTFVKETLLAEIQHLEHRRRKWMQDLAAFHNLDSNSVTMEIVASLFGVSNEESILNLKNSLKDMLGKIQLLNTENQQLTESALRESRVMKENALGLTGDRANTYGPRGNLGFNVEKNARLVSREA